MTIFLFFPRLFTCFQNGASSYYCSLPLYLGSTHLQLMTDWLLNCCWSRQHSDSRFRVPRDSRHNFTLWRFWESSEFFPQSTDCLFTQVKVMLRLTVSWSLSLGVKPYLGLKARFLLLSDNCGFGDVGRPLWREDRSVIQSAHSSARKW
jgi:hypothetical protein